MIVWDGGNNDFPFFAPDLHITVADPLRPGHELRYHPGETNLRMADVVVINKVDSAEPAAVAAVAANVAATNPRATVIRAESAVTLEPGPSVAGARVLVVEDGPTLTHGACPMERARSPPARPGRPASSTPAVRRRLDRRDLPHLPEHRTGPAGHGLRRRQIEELRAAIDADDCDVVGRHPDRPAPRRRHRPPGPSGPL